MKPLFHPRVQHALTSFVSRPRHSLLLTAPAGSGKRFAADFVASQLLGVSLESLGGQSYKLIEATKGQGISIEAVRELKDFLRLKTTGSQHIRRVVVVENAQLMTIEAQNAFLKQLEEPPLDTVIILTATHVQSLLPTIRSRVHLLSLQNPTTAQLEEYFGANETTRKALRIAGGRIGLTRSLLDKGDDDPLLQHIQIAKTMLQKSAFERLTYALGLNPKEYDLTTLVTALGIVIQAALSQAIHVQQPAQAIKAWHRRAERVYELENSLAYHPQPKLLLTSLCLDL